MSDPQNIWAIAVGGFFILCAIIYLPDLIAKGRGVELKRKGAFGGGDGDFLVALILFPVRIQEALTAKPSVSTDNQKKEREGGEPDDRP